MQATQQLERRSDLERHKRDTLNSLVGEQILHCVGTPRDLLKVQVRPLWDNYYRVNIFIGKDVASAQIADSYFVTVDGDANIIASVPQITKRY